MNVLALEPWYGGSHRSFLDGLVEHSEHTLRTLTMPGRFWRWRMEGGGITLARKVRAAVAEGFEPDVVFATNAVNLPAVLALARPHLDDVPVLLYFHENELTAALPEGEKRERAHAMTNYLSALAADRVAFNSRFHFEEFIEGLPLLLRDFPDFTNMHTIRDVREKSTVLHRGIDLAAHDAYDAPAESSTGRGTSHEPPVILWNQRWDHAKNPEAFFRTMNRLDDAGSTFRLILAGRHFREQPEAFERAFERYADRILHYGYAEDFAEYSRLLHRADVVVSTARHEFFGVAIMEAIYCGCHPLLPNRLSYPELVPGTHHEPLLHAPVLYEDDDELFGILQAVLAGDERLLPADTLRRIPRALDWSETIDAYDALLEETASGAKFEMRSAK
jgi:glycosyltransferase involved in cell wall biosynthesis